MAMYKLNPRDTVSPSSITGLLGMYTSNKTWFAMGFTRFYFNQDNWRVTAAGGLGSVNFQFFIEPPINNYVKYNTQADFLYLEVQRRLAGKLYGGIHYTYTYFDTRFEFNPDTSTNIKSLHAIGIKLSMDQRDDVYYPKGGFLSEVDWSSYPKAFGNEFVSNKIEATHTHFFCLAG